LPNGVCNILQPLVLLNQAKIVSCLLMLPSIFPTQNIVCNKLDCI